jgi:tRNA (uracil-5-)-methyltransferase
MSSSTTALSRTEGDVKKTPTNFVAFPFQYHQEVDIRIETLTNRGWGIGRIDVSQNEQQANDDASVGEEVISSTGTQMKWVIMVPNVVPGELARVSIFRNFKNYSEGDLVSVLEPSPDRIEPVCPLADDCGGCQLQHMSIESQRNWKTASVLESLQQYGIETDVSPTLGTEHVFGYRSKLTPHYQAPAKRRRGGPTVEGDKNIQAIGFQRQTSRSIIDVTTCPIATLAVNEKYEQARTELRSKPSTRTKGATLLFRQANLDDQGDAVSTNHQDYLTTRVRGLDFTYQAGNFFQNNYYVLPLMVDHVVEHASAPSHGIAMTHLVDCYCGSGLFALSAASHFETVVGIEINDKAVKEATANAVANDITNCHFRAAAAEAIFADIRDFPGDTTSVVLDPPRKGCSEDFLEQLYAFAPKRIVYMSCDPTTQARDALGIVGTGRYRITSVQPFDLFPQTRHIECLVIFERKD